MSGPDRGAETGASMEATVTATARTARVAAATTGEAPIGRPWYVQFWPLFLVFLMVASIGGSLATVALAYRHADIDVRAASAQSGESDGARGETARVETGSSR